MGRVIEGDCLEAMRGMADASVDAVVTDPPYGLAFMGASWDSFAASGKKSASSETESFQAAMTPVFREALRVSKPGAHLLCFGGTLTYHRLACAIEDAGWEVRDCLMWVYGTGFPKSMDVSKAIDRALGAEREKVPATGGLANYAVLNDDGWSKVGQADPVMDSPVPATAAAAAAWEGWGTCLKPAWEPILLARKPLDGTVVNTVLTHGTGALNLGECRVGDEQVTTQGGDKFPNLYGKYQTCKESTHTGRFPANLIHDGSDEVVSMFPDSKGQQGDLRGTEPSRPGKNVYGDYGAHVFPKRGDSGSAARFFYCAKASKKDRGEGNDHPTVKPTALMEYLVRLVTREGQTVLDPFAGSGSTLVACERIGRDYVGIEREPKYCEIIRNRLDEEVWG